MNCHCSSESTLVNITIGYSEFIAPLKELEYGNWVKLMECVGCKQLWKIDEWDKYQALYAVKVPAQSDWEKFDNQSMVKESMIKNRDGLEESDCKWAGCDMKKVKGKAYCINHLYETGARS